MDELTKYRMTGAILWLGLLVYLVPAWYSNPVDYVKTQQLFKIEAMTPTETSTPSISLPDESSNRYQNNEPTLPSSSDDVLPPLVQEPPSEVLVGQWLVRVASYSNIQSANRMVDQLAGRYQATIGDFSNQDRKIYSVRVGPFERLSQAEEAKKVLDKEFSIDAVVVRVK